MMSSQSMQTLIDPVFRNKMPLFDGTVASVGLSKPQSMSDLLGKQTLQYNGACFAPDPRGKDGAGFSPMWSNSKASLLDGRSPMTHLPGMEGQNRITCRQDSNSSEEGRSHSSPLCHTQVKPGFMLYTKSPSVSSPTAATTVAARKQKTGGENLSPPENTVYLAVPKPVYGHNPCCNELGCVIGRRYRVEQGSPRIPHTVYEHDWMQADAHYAERPPISRNAQDPLLQQRGLQYEHSAESLKRMTVEAYSPSRARTFPAVIDPNYSGYPCPPTHPLFGSLSEQRQRLRTPPKGYPILYPPHPTYEHMTSEVYQECSPMSKYGQLTQHPVFYYPQANVEVENRTQCKDISSKQREDVPVILKHTMSNPREHFIVPQSLRGELPLPSAETLPNHSFMRAFDYPCYPVPRFHLNSSQISPPLKTQHVLPSLHSNHINASPSSQHMDHLMASAASLHKGKSTTSLHVDKSHAASPFLCVEQTSSTRHISQSGISPPSIQVNRFFPPLTSLHVDQPIPSPAGVNMSRLMDYNRCEAHVTCPKLLKGLPVSQAAWLPRSPTHSSDHAGSAATNSAKVRKIICSPAVATGNKHDNSASSTGTGLVKGCLKRSTSQSSPSIKIKEEDKDVCEVENLKKRRKAEMENVKVGNKTDSPPMPVIDNVFSLAPCQTYLQATGVVFPGRAPLRDAESPEHHGVKPKSDIKEKSQDQEEQQPVESLDPKENCPDSPTEEPVVDAFEPKTLKVEKVEPSDTDGSETPPMQKDCSKIIKKESEQNGSSDSGPMFVIKTCEPDEVESKPSLPDENSEEFKPAELTAQTNSCSQGDTSTLHKQVVTDQPKSVTPPQPPETKVNFRNIPPQCLKLSTYKIILPDAKTCSPILPPQKAPAQPMSDYVPKVELQIPVRTHFLELHNSLCKLVSKFVSGSSKQKLNTWLSQMKLSEPTSSSAKVQKVSSLLGVKARDVWLNEEMESALHKVLERLREYTIQEHCPFPHVMRAGAVFIPMLVLKELLFPMVQGSFIDQVLQEHKVELRPTTLSEEKILIQLHKRACSSRLRRLMSLKHLPDIYADVVNLFYYACVCKHLGLDTDKETVTCSPFTEITGSPDSSSESYPKDQEATSHLKRRRRKSRVKRSSRYMFLDHSLSDEEKASDTEKMTNRGVLNELEKSWDARSCEETAIRGSDHMVVEEDSSLIPYSRTSENSWTCPLTLDELSSSDTDTEDASNPVIQSSGPAGSSARSKNCSGMILKLRRMFSEGLKRKKACYQAVSNSETSTCVSLSETSDGKGELSHVRDVHRRVPKATHRWQRTGSYSHALRPLSSSSSKRKHRSLLKIKYCPYLSACHSAEHRRRWVLRSAVQTARRAMRFYYPDLVGKRIHHLYEEDDKSEVWYRGEVLRIHEAHRNPLKTIFEVRYDSEPEWRYYLELLIDYKKGWLKIED